MQGGLPAFTRNSTQLICVRNMACLLCCKGPVPARSTQPCPCWSIVTEGNDILVVLLSTINKRRQMMVPVNLRLSHFPDMAFHNLQATLVKDTGTPVVACIGYACRRTFTWTKENNLGNYVQKVLPLSLSVLMQLTSSRFSRSVLL